MDGGLDHNEVVWMYNYHRPNNDQKDRDLTCLVYDGSWGGDTGSSGSSQETDVLNNDKNLQFPVVAYDKSSGATNRVFFAVLDDTNGNFQIKVGYHTGSVSSSSPPSDTTNAWGTVKGPFATAVSDANYARRPILNMISTPGDGNMWVQYIEKSTDLGANIRALYSSDQFNTVHYYDITANSYGKGHQMSSSVAIGGTDYLYTTYYMTEGELTDVNYDVYLAVYHVGFQNDSDNEAAEVLRETVTPSTYNESSGYFDVNLAKNPTIELTGTIDDADTGRSNIHAASWVETDTSVTSPPSTGWAAMTLTGTNTVTEEAHITMTPSWSKGTVHRLWIRSDDGTGNYAYSYIDVYVVDAGGVQPVTTYADPTWNLISFPWMSTPTSITDALNGWSWSKALVYDNQNKMWYSYDPSRPAKYNAGFPLIDNKMGLWVQVSSHSQSSGTGSGTTDIPLYTGWNLVGYPTGVAHTVSDALNGVPYDYVQTYDNSTGQIVTLSDTDYMHPGMGYWIHVTSDHTWSVTWENP